MPKYEWKLEDSKSCEGCVLLVEEGIAMRAEIYNDFCAITWNVIHDKKRPQQCLDELGE